MVLWALTAGSEDTMKRLTSALLAAWLTLSGLAFGTVIPPSDDTKLRAAARLVFEYHSGLVEIEARDLPLDELLKALAAKASVGARLAEPSLASCSVNAKRQQATSLREAIERLLQGFSYALYPGDSGTLTLTILAACPPARSDHSASLQPTAKNVIADASPQVPADENAQPEEGAPLTLDEFEPLSVAEPSHDGEEGQAVADPSEQEVHAYQDAVISRAFKALHSPHHHLKEEAVGSLAGISNPEVAHVLIEAASGKLDLDTEARTNAVAALWQNTTGTGSPDAAAVGALQQLAKDADPEISSIATNALIDLQQRAVVSAAPVP